MHNRLIEAHELGGEERQSVKRQKELFNLSSARKKNLSLEIPQAQKNSVHTSTKATH
jgi:hypothetical protein